MVMLDPEYTKILQHLKDGNSIWQIEGIPDSVCMQVGKAGENGKCTPLKQLAIVRLIEWKQLKRKSGFQRTEYVLTEKGIKSAKEN